MFNKIINSLKYNNDSYTLYSHALNELALISGSRIFAAFGTLIFTKVFTYFLPKPVFGDQNLIVCAVGFLVGIGINPLVNAANRFFYYYIEERRLEELVYAIGKYYIIIAMGFSVLLLSVIIAIDHDSEKLALALFASILLWSTGINQLGQGLLNTARRRLTSSIMIVLTSILNIFLPLIAVLILGPNIIAVLGGLSASQLIVAIITSISAWELLKTYSDSPSENSGQGVNAFHSMNQITQALHSKAYEKEIIQYARPFFISYLFGWVMSFADRYLIRVFADSSSVAAYSVAYQVGSVPLLMITSIFSQWAQPILFQASAAGKDVDRTLARCIGYFFILSVPIAFLIWLLAPEIINLLAGDNYRESVIVVPWIVLGHLFYTTAMIVEIAFYIAKKTNILAWINGFAAVINLGGNVLMIPYKGILGAAIITTITYGFQLGSYFSISKRLVKWDTL
jgi:O-antigen/teichoic acid export membrane protein